MPDEAAPHRDAPRPEQIASTRLPDGRIVAVYRPDTHLWLCLRPLIFGDEGGAWVDLEVKRRVLAHCSDAPDDLPLLTEYALAHVIVDKWPADDWQANVHRDGVKECLERGARRVREMERLIEIGIDPPPSIQAGIAETIKSKLCAKLPPLPSEALAARLAARQAPPPENPATVPVVAGSPSEQNPAAAGPTSDDQPDDGKDTNARVKEELEKNPHATSVDIYKATGIPNQTVRRSRAWRERHQGQAQQKPKSTDAIDHARPLTTPMLAVIDSNAADPAEIVAEREGQDDPDALDPIELLRRQYLEGATPAQRAKFNGLPPAERENELRSWQITGDRLPDEPTASGPLRGRIRRLADRRPDSSAQ